MRKPAVTIRAVALGLVLNASAVAAAQDWPTRPITMVIPFAAGSGSDIAGRILAPYMSELLGRPIIVENVGGAGGITAASRVARAAPDGYQILLGTAGTHAVNQTLYRKLPYNAATDFAPVALTVEQPIAVIARTDLPVNGLRELVNYLKGNQARSQYGSPGAGTAPHLACALLNASIGVEITHVPYRGAAPAMQDLMAGRIDYQCATFAPTIPQIEGKLVKGIALLSRMRSPVLPTLPTAHEQGLTDFEATGWYAFFLPKGTPQTIVRKFNEVTDATMNMPIVRQRLREVGSELVAPERRSPEYLQEFVASEIRKWAAAIKAAGVSLD